MKGRRTRAGLQELRFELVEHDGLEVFLRLDDGSAGSPLDDVVDRFDGEVCSEKRPYPETDDVRGLQGQWLAVQALDPHDFDAALIGLTTESSRHILGDARLSLAQNLG